ncbi:MAG: cation-transporting P-type ATPase [Acidobacteria bacterium]|nr:cation-transporting P-type ATPase [Acidobacteriota bacterium]
MNEPITAHWASLPADKAITALASSSEGLDEREVAARLLQHGSNTLPRPFRRPWYLKFAADFVHLFALLLWTGAILAWVAGMPQLTWAIVAVILINGCFSYWQEYQAERAAEALQALLPRQVTVRRRGQEQMVRVDEIVPGDWLVLTEGEAVPADARLVAVERLRVDASSLTGESRPVPRSAGAIDPTGKTSAALSNLVFAGTTVAGGRGEAVVFATGAATEFGRIAQLTHVQNERPSPLQLELERVTRVVTFLAAGLGIIFFIVGTFLGGLSPLEGFLFAIGIIVANVPEGLLPTLTLALALGVRKMAKRNALVKRLSAVETLGATTVILTDKTGTLTENEMTVRETWAAGIRYQLNGTGYDLTGTVECVDHENDSQAMTQLLRTAALCCDARLIPPAKGRDRWQILGDPTEAAILVAAAKIGLSQENLSTWPRLAELPFDSTRKRMTTIQQIEGSPVACVKGAPSEIFPRCIKARWSGEVIDFDNHHRRIAEIARDQLADRGLRVLAVAARDLDPQLQGSDGWRVDEVERNLTLLGLLAMEDPPRPEVPAALAACHQAGVRVIMVTGDDGLTAAAISREIGLHTDHTKTVTGAELDTLDPQKIGQLLDNPNLLFARVAPEHKMRLVEAFQQRGEVVAVTGDGVNDAPALKRADIGVAMGATGTDVARQAADMILADDNFASIVAAIEEGRAVYDNVRKFVTYIFASNVPEIIPFVAFVLFRIPLPLTVMQILAVDLGTDLLPALALGADPAESDVMRRPPRARNSRLLNPSTLLRSYCWLGLIEAGFAFGGYFFAYWLAGWHWGIPLSGSGPIYLLATTMSLASIVACQVGNAFACRSSRQSIRQIGFASNRMLFIGIFVELALLLFLIYTPSLAAIFGLAPLRPRHWLLLILFGPLLLLLEEGRKVASRHMDATPTRRAT